MKNKLERKNREITELLEKMRNKNVNTIPIILGAMDMIIENDEECNTFYNESNIFSKRMGSGFIFLIESLMTKFITRKEFTEACVAIIDLIDEFAVKNNIV